MLTKLFVVKTEPFYASATKRGGRTYAALFSLPRGCLHNGTATV